MIEKTHLALLGVKIARPAFRVYDMRKIKEGLLVLTVPFKNLQSEKLQNKKEIKDLKFFKENDKTPFILVAFGIILYLVLSNLQIVFAGLSYASSVAFPFILGSCLAFIINVPMRFFETHVFQKIKKGKRGLSLIVALLCIIGVIILVSGLIIPELVDTIFKLSNNIPGYVKEIQEFLEHYSINKPMVHKYVNQLSFDWDKVSGELIAFLQDSATNMLNSTVSVISNAVQVVVSFVLGFVFALNALLQKEKLSVQVRKVLAAFLPERVAKYIVRVGRLSNNAFSSFLSGQCLEAVILGSLIFASMKLLGLPYAVLIAVFIAVMSLIPIIGGFIGCWVGELLILMVDWKQAIIFIIMFVVVQQFEGNVIYPHVVGNSVGLPAIWVLVAVTIGGNIVGIPGMLFSIPFCSVLYQLFSEVVNKQIKKKNVDIP